MASNTSDDEEGRPAASALEGRRGTAPAIHNLELVVGIKPLRSEPGALPSSASAADVPAIGGHTDVENAP